MSRWKWLAFDPEGDEPTDIATVLRHYGFEGDVEGDWRRIRCPFHDDSRASASVSADRGAFKCFACPVAGDAVSVIREVEGCDWAEALRRYEEITGKTTARPSHRGSSKDAGTWGYERKAAVFPDWML